MENKQYSSNHPIAFKPLSQGLGFHPFADGLPYAPDRSQPSREIRSTKKEFSSKRIEQIKKDLEALSQKYTPNPIRVLPEITPLYGIGYSLKRFLAYGLDSFLNLSFCLFVLSQVLTLTDFSIQQIALSGLFLFLFNWSVITAQEIAFETSLGKRLFRLKLPGTGKEVFFRALLFIPSLLLLGLGILMALLDPQKRGWHDRMTSIQPQIKN